MFSDLSTKNLKFGITKMFEMINYDLGFEICLKAVAIGKDVNLMIYGGDSPHIGSAAFGVPYLNSKNKVDCSVSNVSVPRHKEYEITIKLAEKIAKRLNTNALVSCGIHVENIDKKTIEKIVELVDDLVEQMIYNLNTQMFND